MMEQLEGRRCFCGTRARVWTSWTNNNPGRRFYGCPNFKVNRSCGFFVWHDPPICDRGKQLIPKLLKKLEHNRTRERMYWVALAISWAITIVVLLKYM